ncbi:unnamed protein product [Orchesella dallaii]|uniref:Uncharacterized protein n=1 Tax=Orchesella dallaii TaxID=48710 RepID=A0ABP1QZT1_9HEXA
MEELEITTYSDYWYPPNQTKRETNSEQIQTVEEKVQRPKRLCYYMLDESDPSYTEVERKKIVKAKSSRMFRVQQQQIIDEMRIEKQFLESQVSIKDLKIQLLKLKIQKLKSRINKQKLVKNWILDSQ